MKSFASISAVFFWTFTLFFNFLTPDAKAQPCRVNLVNINGIVPPGGTIPTQLRVMGNAVCDTVNVQVKRGQIIVTQQNRVIPNANARFVVTLPIIANLNPPLNCGEIITIDAWCKNCPTTSKQLQLECCKVDIESIHGIVLTPGTSLTPTHIRVNGQLLGCFGDSVVVKAVVLPTNMLIGQSQPTISDLSTGDFSVLLPTPTNVAVNCDTSLGGYAWCSSDTSCKVPWDKRLECTDCFRAIVKPIAAPCTGTPPKQPIQLNADISIAAGDIKYFLWDYGDGTPTAPHWAPPPAFLADNSTGKANKIFTYTTPSNNYVPGSYTARLFVVLDTLGTIHRDCDPILLPLTVHCPSACPTDTVSKTGESACVNGKRTVTLEATVTAPTNSPAVGQWNSGPSGSPTLGHIVFVPAGQTQIKTAAFDYPPGGPYTACIEWDRQAHPACKDECITFSVTPCPKPNCPVDTNVTVTAEIEDPPGSGNWKDKAIYSCIPANSPIRFTAKVKPLAATIKEYNWDFKDQFSSTATNPNTITKPTSNTNDSQTHYYGQPAPNGQAYAPVVQVFFNETACKPIVGSTSIFICQPDLPPIVTGCSVSAGTPGTITVTFSEDVDQTTAQDPANYAITVNGQAVTPTSISYNPNTATINGVTINPSDAVTVTVTGVQDKAGNVIVGNNQTNVASCSAPPQPDITPPTVTGCSVSAGTPGTITITFSEDVDQTTAQDPANYAITVNGQTVTPSSISYSPNTATINGVTINPGEAVTVTVTGVRDKAGNVIVGNNVAKCFAPVPPKPEEFCWCCVLLALALLAFLAAVIFLAIASCFQQPWAWILFGIFLAVAIICVILLFIFCEDYVCPFLWVLCLLMLFIALILLALALCGQSCLWIPFAFSSVLAIVSAVLLFVICDVDICNFLFSIAGVVTVDSGIICLTNILPAQCKNWFCEPKLGICITLSFIGIEKELCIAKGLLFVIVPWLVFLICKLH